MSDLDARLAAAIGTAAPSEQDALFRLGVLARMERARFRRRIVRGCAIVLIPATLVALNAQAVDTWMASDPWHGWIVGLAALAAMFALPGVPTVATPGVRVLVKGLGNWFSA